MKYAVENVEHAPKGTIYQMWMERQLEEVLAFDRYVLSKPRFELFRNGKLELKQKSAHGRIEKLSEFSLGK